VSGLGSWFRDRFGRDRGATGPQGRQQQLTETLAYELGSAQTEAWDTVRMTTLVAGDRTDLRVSAEREGRFVPDQRPTTQAFQDALAELRAIMARPGQGTWYTMNLTVHADGGPVETRFDDEHEPHFLPPVDPVELVKDQERYPRDVEHQPWWLKERLSWGVLTPEQWRRADAGRGTLEGPPPMGGSRHPFTVTLRPGDDMVVVRDDWSGRRALVAPDESVTIVEAEPPTREA
jgi:hypothetical protein